MKKQRPVVSKLKSGGKKPEPLKYFRDQYESKKKAFGGSMLEGASSMDSDNPAKRRRQQARQQRQIRRGKPNRKKCKKQRVRADGTIECLDNMA